jgi:hypothetical protein
MLPLSNLIITRAARVRLLLIAGLSLMASRASAEQPLIDIQACFIKATKQQLTAAMEAVHIASDASVLTPEQFHVVRRELEKSGSTIFSEQGMEIEDGEHASIQEVRELRFASRYEPSKKTPGRFVAVEFGSRDIGTALDVTASVGRGGKIHLTETPAVTRFLGFVDDSNLGSKTPPVLEDLLKAPLPAGGKWRPFFASFKETGTFVLNNGETSVMSGPITVELKDTPASQPHLKSRSAPIDVVLFLTAKSVDRN